MSSAIQRVPFRVASEIQLHGGIRARYLVAPNAQIPHPRTRSHPSSDVARVRNRPPWVVAVEVPESHEPPDRGIEKIPGASREILRAPDERGDFRGRANARLAAGDRIIERNQVAGSPGAQLAMHAIEFSENLRYGRPLPGRLVADNGDLDDGAEDVRARAVFLCASAGELQPCDKQERELARSPYQRRSR